MNFSKLYKEFFFIIPARLVTRLVSTTLILVVVVLSIMIMLLWVVVLQEKIWLVQRRVISINRCSGT